MKTKIRHVLNAEQFDFPLLYRLFDRAEEMRSIFFNDAGGREYLRKRFPRRLMFYIFYEPSTRTRLSFCAAACHLGMMVNGTVNARQFSSVSKGETEDDTMRVLAGYYPDVIVIRHDTDGAVAGAAACSKIPVINAGDGKGEHPTQALLDLYTIWRRHKRLGNLTILMGGDLLRGRTVHSLARVLSKSSDIRFIFVSPEELKMKDQVKDVLRERGVDFIEIHHMDENIFAQADVWYWTRTQRERPEAGVSNIDKGTDSFIIGSDQMRWMKQNGILMHPLPRVGEILEEVDLDPRAAYFRQTENGMWIRMALLEWVMGGF